MTDRREPLVLVLGFREEWAADAVGKELDARGAHWIPLNVADFPLTMTLGARLTTDTGGWHGSLRSAEHDLPLREVTAVYYGRPTEFVMPSGLSGPELRFSRAQARVGIVGVLASLPVRWMSHPSALADAAYKPWQLAMLRQAGLKVPPTLVTNDAEAVRDFAKAFGDLIVKPLAESVVYESGGEALVYTRGSTLLSWIPSMVWNRPRTCSSSGNRSSMRPGSLWSVTSCSPWQSTLGAKQRT